MADSPDLAALSAPLLGLIPELQRATAQPLVEELLAIAWAEAAVNSAPQRVLDLWVSDTREALLDAARSDRLSVLRDELAQARRDHDSKLALSLAIARYLLEHPGTEPGRWASPTVQSWQAQGEGAIALEATELLNQLETYAAHLQVLDPERAEGSKGNLHAARMALQSARSGSFQSAWGPLADFLRAVGADFQVLEVRFS